MRGRYSVQALAQTDLHFNSFDFVRLGGRPGHEGYFPIQGQPVAGEPLTVRARLDGPLASAAFHLLSEAGEPLQSLPLRRDGDEFFGPLEPPGPPFRAAVAGYDEGRFPYQRVLPQLIRIQTVQVSPAATVTELPAGALVNVPFLVRNLGPEATFQVVILDHRGAPSQPVHVHLPSGASALLEAPVETPRRPGASLSVTVTANSTTDPDRVNSATLSLTVIAP